MKGSTLIIALVSISIFTSCKKDVGIAPEPTVAPTPQPTPFVEFRDSFLGNYAGILSTVSQTYAYFSNGGNYRLYDTVTVINNITYITKSTLSNSLIISTSPSGTFGLLSTGNYSYYAPPSTPSPFAPGEIQNYSVCFRNDSVYFSIFRMYQPGYRYKDVYIKTTFNGKKQ